MRNLKEYDASTPLSVDFGGYPPHYCDKDGGGALQDLDLPVFLDLMARWWHEARKEAARKATIRRAGVIDICTVARKRHGSR